jgi:hypothetical protein
MNMPVEHQQDTTTSGRPQQVDRAMNEMSRSGAPATRCETRREDPDDSPESEPPRAPADMRQVFQLLSALHTDDELDDVLARVDFSGVSAADLDRLILGTVPPNGEEDPRASLRQALLSRKFRERAVPALLGSFPSLPRDIFIHVPKCAGTDLTASLRDRVLPLPASMGDAGFVGENDFLATLGDLAAKAPDHNRIFIYGHINLGAFLARSALRPEDQVFSIIRDPIGLMVSQANYAIGRVRQDPKGHDPDTAQTLRRLGLEYLPDGLSDGELKDLTVRALLDRDISPANQACRHLGSVSGAGFDDAIVHIIANNVEITTTRFYNRWLKERWDIPQSRRHNQSDTVLTVQEAVRLYSHDLARSTSEDQKLFDLVTWAIENAGTSSVTGRQIARLIAPKPAIAFATELTRNNRAAQENEAKGVFLIEEPRLVGRYLQRPSISPPFSPVATEVISASFAAAGNGYGYLGPGWYLPEDSFVWSRGRESILWLPPGPRDGVSIIQIVGTPFVAGERLASQEIEISVNGRSIGSRKLRAYSLIEFEIPQDMTEEGAPLEIALKIPGAARASSVSDSQDHRVLGFSLQRMNFINYSAPGNSANF